MHVSRRSMILSGIAAGALLPLAPAFGQNLRTIRLGVGLKILNSTFLNVMIGERLGTLKTEGLHLEGLALGAMSSVFVALDKGDIEFGIMSPSVVLPLYAKGELPPITAFYEYTYPYKWDVAVAPNSPLQRYEDLRGKKIGVSNLGSTDYPVTAEVLKNLGIAPDKDVSWIAVGEGVTGGVALNQGSIDALAYFDTGFATIENAGITLRYLPRPQQVPMIGGFFIGARRDFIAKNRAACVGFGRAIAMASEFTLANPPAAARAFLDLYPSAAPRDASPAEAVAQIANQIRRRIDLYRPPYPGVKMGGINEAEIREEAEFAGIAIKDLTPLYTNDLIDEINDFDRNKVIAEAKAAKI
jgi:NitT/TauT family transport system substrate-binding protein